ncbi:hypothetical protein EOD42_09800 [Rhodovarius crocodyli]|uniref:Uncharacterized protein n=1 Tax=Rhodovarius crocodyli TaxID=1979269 RepID=A0A437MGD0_9PROT|nr:hypothetical protein [Rhodovarius crocodyli]RVT96699.1 hypothetical protein EOD42_09800 [Rhodovarius crocodyli]
MDQFIAEGEIDYIALYLIIDGARDYFPDFTEKNQMEKTLQFIGLMIDRGFLAVDLLPDGKCKPWPDQEKSSILRRIERDWSRDGDEMRVGMEYWFHWPYPPQPA